jgi:hypothetical protein
VVTTPPNNEKEESMTLDELHPTARKVLDFITRFNADQHYPPTYEEIRAGCRLSTKSLVNYWVTFLLEQGLLTKRWDLDRECQMRALIPTGLLIVQAEDGSHRHHGLKEIEVAIYS